MFAPPALDPVLLALASLSACLFTFQGLALALLNACLFIFQVLALSNARLFTLQA